MDLIKSLLNSKKFIAAIIAAIVAIGARYGLNIDPELIRELVAIFVAYIIGQGLADRGKAAAQITAMAEISPSEAKAMIKDPNKP